MPTTKSTVPKSPPTTMRAWQYISTKGGLPSNLYINPSATTPKPTPSQHLVRVRAVALNPVDYKPAEVQLLHRVAIPKPATPGIDFVGEVVTPAAGSSFKPGQLIFGVGGTTPFAGGMLAEYAIVKNDSAIALPEGMDPVDAASIGVAGLTAIQSIVPRMKGRGRIFINGGSGGTGIFGIQFAKALGHEVTVTCSSRNVALCRELGAEVIDYTKGSVLPALQKHAQRKMYDLVIDNVFNDPNLYWKAHEYTSPDAKYLVIAGSPSFNYLFTTLRMRMTPGFLGGGRRKLDSLFAEANIEQLTQIRTWFQEKKVRAVIDEMFSFEEAPRAFEKLKTGRAVGKIVVGVLLSEK